MSLKAKAEDSVPGRVCGLRGRKVLRRQTEDGGLPSGSGKTAAAGNTWALNGLSPAVFASGVQVLCFSQ